MNPRSLAKVSIRNRPVLPALLSFGGAILPGLLLAVFLEPALSTLCPDPNFVGGAASPLTCIFDFVYVAIFSIMATLSLAFSLLLLCDNRRHRAWEIVVVAWYGLITGLTLISALILSQVGLTYSPLAIALVFTPLLGVGGGVLAILWRPAGEEKKLDSRMWNVGPS